VRSWTTTLVLFFHLALYLPNGWAQNANALSTSIPEGTKIVVSFSGPFDMRAARAGDLFTTSVDSQVVVNNQILVPEGSMARGHVAKVRRPSRLKQLGMPTRPVPEVDLALDELITPDGVKYSISADLANPEEVSHILLVPSGYGLTFAVKRGESHQGPSAVATPAPEQNKSKELPTAEPWKSSVNAQVQPIAPENKGGPMPAEKPAQRHAPLTPAQAREKAQALLGGPPGRVEFYYCEDEKLNYLAFSSSRQPLGSEVWLYKESDGSQDFRQQWHEVFDVFSVAPDRFFLLPGEKLPFLRLEGAYGGNAAGNTRLALYSVKADSITWVDYQEDWSVGGHEKVTVDETHVSDPDLRKYLESWAHTEGVDRPRIPSDPEELVNVEQAWIDANGHMTSGVVKISFYKNLRVGGEHVRLDDNHSVFASVPDGRYVWYTIFKGPVGGYDKITGQYFMVYVPESRYDWATGLKVVGPWLYIAPNNENWKLRFNKTTHQLEQGDFPSIVDSHETGASSAARLGAAGAAAITGQKNATPLRIHPFDLLKNPYVYRGKVVELDVGSWPYVLNGQVYRWAPIVGPTWAGIEFDRMLTENEALYNVKGLDINDASGGLRTLGQMVVLVPSANSQLNPGRVWLVRPLGVESGTNYFGAVIQTPKVQFLKYADE